MLWWCTHPCRRDVRAVGLGGLDDKSALGGDASEVGSDGIPKPRFRLGRVQLRGGKCRFDGRPQLVLFSDERRLSRRSHGLGEHQLVIVYRFAEPGEPRHQHRTLAPANAGADESCTGVCNHQLGASDPLLKLVAW